LVIAERLVRKGRKKHEKKRKQMILYFASFALFADKSLLTYFRAAESHPAFGLNRSP